MQTEWHNYKSSKTGRVTGAYGYCPEHSEDNLVHVYVSAGCYVAYFHVKDLHTRSGPIVGARTLDGAKTAAMRVLSAHITGQGDLSLHPYIL